MVDVGEKPETRREALARGCVRLSPEAFRAVVEGSVHKGDVLGVARLVGLDPALSSAPARFRRDRVHAG
jgi:cyclic pyranopterin monophosphate synthase